MKWLTNKMTVVYIMIIMLVAVVITAVQVKGMPIAKNDTLYTDSWTDLKTTAKYGSRYFKSGTEIYTLTMGHVLTDDMRKKVISFHTNDSFVDAYISDMPMYCGENAEQIYHFGVQLDFCDSPGTYTHFITIPDTEAKYITIRIQTAYKNKFLSEYDVSIGTENELIFNSLRSELISVVLNQLMLIFGILLMVIYIIGRLNGVKMEDVLALGALSIVFTVYANCPLFFNQYIFRNAIVQYYLNYFSLFLLPLLAIVYFEEIVPNLKMTWIFRAFLILEVILTFLHFSAIASYTRTIKVFTAALGVFAIISIVMIAMRFKKLSPINRIGIITLLVCILVNSLFFIFITTVDNQSFIVKAGFLIYLILGIGNALHKITDGFFKEREDELLYDIAYTDNLTKLGNRYALERDTKNYPIESISIVSLDLNYLKYTNDTFGHSGGDTLLKCAAECISSVYDMVYRVGGDEFIALVPDKKEADLRRLHDKLQEKAYDMNLSRTSYGEYADRSDFTLSIADGYASYEKGDENYEPIMNRADAAMYQVKKRMHKSADSQIPPRGKAVST